MVGAGQGDLSRSRNAFLNPSRLVDHDEAGEVRHQTFSLRESGRCLGVKNRQRDACGDGGDGTAEALIDRPGMRAAP